MSQADVDTIRAGLAALNRRDVDGMLATLRPDAELVPLRAVLEGIVYRGHEGLRRWLADMAEDWDDLRIDTDDVRALDGGRVLVLARFHARGKSSGVRLDQPAAWICELVEGKVARIRFYADAGAALGAAASQAPAEGEA
jgi:ketosteroid isomerase-like protein